MQSNFVLIFSVGILLLLLATIFIKELVPPQRRQGVFSLAIGILLTVNSFDLESKPDMVVIAAAMCAFGVAFIILGMFTLKSPEIK